MSTKCPVCELDVDDYFFQQHDSCGDYPGRFQQGPGGYSEWYHRCWKELYCRECRDRFDSRDDVVKIADFSELDSIAYGRLWTEDYRYVHSECEARRVESAIASAAQKAREASEAAEAERRARASAEADRRAALNAFLETQEGGPASQSEAIRAKARSARRNLILFAPILGVSAMLWKPMMSPESDVSPFLFLYGYVPVTGAAVIGVLHAMVALADASKLNQYESNDGP